jgi:hypothetical protein
MNVKDHSRVAFFVWTAALGKIRTLDNFFLISNKTLLKEA